MGISLPSVQMLAIQIVLFSMFLYLFRMSGNHYSLLVTEFLLAYCDNRSIDGMKVVMTEDHKLCIAGERDRIAQTGNPLKDGQSRILGMFLFDNLMKLYCGAS
jgi:hypothetical protein